MRKYLLLLSLFLCSLTMYAQPVNDDCTGLIDLGVVPFCPDTVYYNNIGATQTDIGGEPQDEIPPCWNGGFIGRDVWFMFTASDTIIDYTITLTGIADLLGNASITNPQIAVYRGDCSFGNMALFACASAPDGETLLEMDVFDMDPGQPYFIRINDYSSSAAPNEGSFQLCIDEMDPISIINGGGSSACSGTLLDTGGEGGDYSSNENNVFSICPNDFNNCIEFNLEFFNIEEFGDEITFYDGPDATGTPIVSLGGGGFGNPGGGGGVCYNVQAASGCLTVEFISDGDVEFEGFAGTWQCSSLACDPQESVVLTPTASETEIIDFVSTPQTTVTVDTIICNDLAYGTFLAGDNTDLGLEKGLLLTSGSVTNALGPNTSGSTTAATGSGGDADLDYLSSLTGGANSNDACIVELDVFVATDELTFEYIFGSEEYPEFVNSTFNDIFALLVSGPGIVGDPMLSNSALNIATLPGTTNPVEINSVNNLQNWEYYRNNEGVNGVTESVEYDGLTSDYLGIKKSLTASVPVTPCNTYHLKLAIADRGDSSFDSGVFISEIRGGTPNLEVNFASGLDYFIEGCSGEDDELLIFLNNPLDEEISYTVVIEGTAQLGVDYLLDIPSVITLAPGVTNVAYPIIPIVDNLDEGPETIRISLTNNFGCGDIVYTVLEVELHDEPEVNIFADVNGAQDTAFVCQGSTLQMNVSGAIDYNWTPISVFDDDQIPDPIADPPVSQMVYVTGFVGPCFDSDSVYLEIIDPQLNISTNDPQGICQGTSVTLTANNNVNNTDLIWEPAIYLDDPTVQNPVSTPDETTTYSASVTVAGCVASDQITIEVDEFDFPAITTVDTTLCQGEPLTLASTINFTTTTYEWTPDQYFADTNTISGPTVVPQENITYTLLASSENDFCSQAIDVFVEVFPADVTIDPGPYVEICLGESIDLTALTTTQGVGFQWEPNPTLFGATTDTSVIATPTVSTLYFAELMVGACTVLDSILVRVDSLPESSILAVPAEAPYCPGELVSLISQTYEPSSFPDIMHQWTPGDFTQSDLMNWNLVTNPLETITYTRETVNRACEVTESFTVEIIDPVLEFSFLDTTFCEGESAQLMLVEQVDMTDIVWTPNGELSCFDCLDPISSDFDTITYTVTANVQGCPAEGQVTVNVIQAPRITDILATDLDGEAVTEIPVGEEIILSAETDPTDLINNGVFSWSHNQNALSETSYTITFQIVDETNEFNVVVTDENGCMGDGSISILGIPPRWELPNAFTPDGDGNNDLFNLVSEGTLIFNKFQVYNRWGQLVYDADNLTNGWDGTQNGKMAPSDVYVYVISFTLPNGEVVNMKGDVTLIR